MSYIDVKDVKPLIEAENGNILHLWGFEIPLSRQKTGFGVRMFFLCPRCGERRAKLYDLNGRLYCRSCIPSNRSPYAGLTHVTKGGRLDINYRMHRLAKKYDIDIKMPFYYYDYPKPKGCSHYKWEFVMRQLQALENMRNQSIFCKKKWKTRTIRSILDGTNIILLNDDCDAGLTLYEMTKFFIDWDDGVLQRSEQQ